MITVKFYGLMRVESGVRELHAEAESVKALLRKLEDSGFDRRSLKGCCILVNGVYAAAGCQLKDGDVVQLLPPVAGG